MEVTTITVEFELQKDDWTASHFAVFSRQVNEYVLLHHHEQGGFLVSVSLFSIRLSREFRQSLV